MATIKGTVPAQVVADDKTYIMHTYGRLPVQFVSGRGAVLTDSQGKEYLDFLGGIGAVSVGHCHPKVVAALQEQAGKLWQVGNYFYEENRNELAQQVCELLSTKTDAEGHMVGSTGTSWRLFFCNSGAEANEGAIKVARRWGEKNLNGATGILTAQNSFHGRTLATLSATGQKVFHKSFLPMPAGFDTVPLNDLEALEAKLRKPSVETGRICAVMLECIQGEGGVWPATPEYLQGVRRICDENDILLIIDEVQTGFFRTGAPFAYQLAGIEPDVVSMAKGIGGGFPMGAFAARGEYAKLLKAGDHGSTFGGAPLAAAVGRATVETLVEEGIGEHVIWTGTYLAQKLATLPHVTEVRGAGLMRGAQFDVRIAGDAVDLGLEHGLVLNHIGDSILRFLPPLVVTEEQVVTMIGRLTQIVNELTD